MKTFKNRSFKSLALLLLLTIAVSALPQVVLAENIAKKPMVTQTSETTTKSAAEPSVALISAPAENPDTSKTADSNNVLPLALSSAVALISLAAIFFIRKRCG